MDDPSPLRTALRHLAFGGFVLTTALIAVLVVLAVLSATGLSSDPHGYGLFGSVFFALLLTPVAMLLRLLHRFLSRRDR